MFDSTWHLLLATWHLLLVGAIDALLLTASVWGLLALALAVTTFPRMVVPPLATCGLAVWFPLLLECLRVGGLLHIFDAAYFANTLLLLGFLWWVYGFQLIADSIWSSLPPPRADRPTLILGGSGGGYAQ